MWRSIGSINSSDNKSSRSKQQLNFQLFHSNDKHNQQQNKKSQRPSQKFLAEYFSKKKNTVGASKRTYSQKNVEIYAYTSSPASLRDVDVKMAKSKQISDKNIEKEEMSQNFLGEAVSNHSIKLIKSPTRTQEINRLSKQLKIVRKEQGSLQQFVEGELQSFGKSLKEMEVQMKGQIAKVKEEMGKKQWRSRGVDPEIYARIRQEGQRLNQRIQQIENRKFEVRQKYKLLQK